MKTKKSLFLTVALALFSVVAFAQTMANTAHDFSDETWAGGDGDGSNAGRTCVVCHIAHNSSSTIAAPLWNRADPATVTQSNYTAYSSSTFNAADGSFTDDAASVWTPAAYADYLADDGVAGEGVAIWTPNGSSVLCLSCHDGVGNLDAFGGVTDGTYTIATGGEKIASTARRNDGTSEHPYSFTYNTALVTADTEGTIAGLKDPTPLLTTGTVRLDSDSKLQCSTCHDVHNAYNNDHLLTLDNAGSALCRTCHTK